MGDETTLIIETKCRHRYRHDGATKVRQAKRELRWTNARGEKRTMALAFIDRWTTEDHVVPIALMNSKLGVVPVMV